MAKNVGGIDRIIRAVVGIGLIYWAMTTDRPDDGCRSDWLYCVVDRDLWLVPSLSAVWHQNLQDEINFRGQMRST